MPGSQMRLGAFLQPAGHHVASWRHPAAKADAGTDIDHYIALARTAERGLFDMIFVADRLGFLAEDREILQRTIRNIAHFEPMTLLSALAVHTKSIGLAATQTTSYMEPYNMARKFASLDYISKGRAAWNVVTSNYADESLNFGREQHLEHGERYVRALEFVEVVTGLWDTWEDDAFRYDKEGGLFFDQQKLHVLNHKGRHFQVKGPLNVARPPQGWPVIIQAGTSEPAKELSARFADVVFSAEQDIEAARAFYADIKGRLAKHGREPDEVKIMPGVMTIVGETRADAQKKFDMLQDLIHPDVGLNLLSQTMETDMTPYDLDGPMPDLDLTGKWSRARLMAETAKKRNYTVRDAYKDVSAARGHRVVFGTAADIADSLQSWFTTGAADGFNIMPPVLPRDLDEFVSEVVPELQKRGLFRTAYAGHTLRDHLGVARPAHRMAGRVVEA